MQFLAASDGVRIGYREIGRGRPLVLLHGLMAHGGFFREQQALADQFRVISIDLRGHGASFAAGEDLSVRRLAEDVAELAEALDLEGAIGVGWSLGASVLWDVLSGPASARFAGAVVVDMTPRVANDGEWRLGLEPEHCQARSRAIAGDFESFATAAGQAIFAQPVASGLGEAARWAGGEFARSDAASIGAVWTSLVERDFRPQLGGIKQPTLIVHGAHSHLYGADTAEHLASALPNALIIQFEHSGHSPHLEQPELFNQTIRDFAAGLPPVRQPETQALSGREP